MHDTPLLDNVKILTPQIINLKEAEDFIPDRGMIYDTISKYPLGKTKTKKG
jgi:hypothetical protein